MLERISTQIVFMLFDASLKAILLWALALLVIRTFRGMSVHAEHRVWTVVLLALRRFQSWLMQDHPGRCRGGYGRLEGQRSIRCCQKLNRHPPIADQERCRPNHGLPRSIIESRGQDSLGVPLPGARIGRREKRQSAIWNHVI